MLPPAPVEPQPLPGIFAHPALDDAVDHLRRRRHIHAAFAIAWQVQGTVARDRETSIRAADDAHADHRAIEMPCEPRDRRVRLATPAEKRDVDAAGKML